jgi:hypothetical protein
LKLRGLDGADKHLITQIKAQMTERLTGKPDSGGAMSGLISFSKIEIKTTLEGKVLPEDKIMQSSLKQVKTLGADIRVDKQGELQTLKVNVRSPNKFTRLDLLDLGSQVLLSLEAVVAPLPGVEVSHDRPWKAKRKLLLGSLRAPQEAQADLTYTYHGMRQRDGKTEVVVFIKGDVRGAKGPGLNVSGRLEGQAIVDLAANQVIFADCRMNMDLDLPVGQGDSLQANGTMSVVMTRKLTEGEERDKLPKEKAEAEK